MNDYSELKQMAEAVNKICQGAESPVMAIETKALLTLIAENERLRRGEKNDKIAYDAVLERQHEIRAERDQLKAENEVMRKDADRDLRVKQAMRLDICEVAAVIGLTDNELDNGAGRMVEAVKGLVQDSERLDWLNIRSAPVVEGQCMGQPEGELAGYQWSVFGACSTVREAIDYAMEGELDHG